MIGTYTARSWSLKLDGLSDKQLEVHYKLYQGYVTNVNTLNQKLNDLNKANEGGTPQAGELRRRLGFEYDGMRLHEFYFDNLGSSAALNHGGDLGKKLTECFGSFDAFMADFKNVATMRGVGWAILYLDPVTGLLQNFWASDHEYGHPAGFVPLLVCDIWEHAWSVDYLPNERPKYLEAFFKNVNWSVIEKRYAAARHLAAV
ncbi:MAG TPA: Fe-Mn family superoxide dismutase [Candidatus Xenobia bacterium]|jgi:Fe-Mn family superoxide dismutase